MKALSNLPPGVSDAMIERQVCEVPFLEAFGARIRERRNSLVLSQEELARFIGITPSTLSRIEAGQIDITIRRAAEIAIQLGLELNELLEGLL